MITALSARIVLVASNAESFAEKVGISSQIMIGKHLSVVASRSARYEEQTLALELAAAGKIQMPIQEVFDLTDVRRAHELLESGTHVGKIAVRA
jgi:D-arabinose 1-dehydrogenase-like Zn-dependent alcohol dehydrogenase